MMPAEEKYASYDLDAGDSKGVKEIRSYLLGISFTIVTDCFCPDHK